MYKLKNILWFHDILAHIHEVAKMSPPRATYGTSGIN